MAKNDIRNYEFEDALNKYLKGWLSKEEESKFIQLLQYNPELKRKAVAIARLADAMSQVGSEQDQDVVSEFKGSDKQTVSQIASSASNMVMRETEPVTANHTANHRILNFKRIMISFSAAASILLCVFGGYKYYLYNETSQLGREYLAYFPPGDFSRGEDNGLQQQFRELYQDIENKTDLDKAISTLESMWNQSQSETYNDYTDAMPEIGWLLANAYLRDNDKIKALDVLSVLISEYPNDSAMGDKSRELKKKIDNL